MLFLHGGGGARGDGLDDLDWVLVHGPLAEAWLQRRNLPFIILSPQLPIVDRTDQVAMRSGKTRPVLPVEGVPPRPDADRPPRPMVRAIDPGPSIFGVTEAWGLEGAPGAPGTGVDFTSRFFAPRYGLPEDPVTGSAHCELAPYWAGRLGKTSFAAYQASPRGGHVLCEVRGARVLLSGSAVTFLMGEMEIGE